MVPRVSELSEIKEMLLSMGVSTHPGKISAVKNWPCPTTVLELGSFLGFVSYCRRFVKGFAKLAAPLHELVAKIQKMQGHQWQQQLGDHWSDDSERGFRELKARLVNARVLAHANFSLPFILEIDASYSGLGAVLFQEQEGRFRPVTFTSCELRPTERNVSYFSSMKMEFLALKWAMTEKF